MPCQMTLMVVVMMIMITSMTLMVVVMMIMITSMTIIMLMMANAFGFSGVLLLLLRSQSHAQTSSPVLTRKSAVRRRDAVGPQSFSFRSTGYGQVSCLRLLCDGQD